MKLFSGDDDFMVKYEVSFSQVLVKVKDQTWVEDKNLGKIFQGGEIQFWSL